MLSKSSPDQRIMDIVNGFIKYIQLLLPNEHNTYYNIPELVNHKCIDYCYNPYYLYRFVDGYDKKLKKWYSAQIIEISQSNQFFIKIHWGGCSSKDDEWINVDLEPDRIASLYSFSEKPENKGVVSIFDVY